jgi:hypothetical protein
MILSNKWMNENGEKFYTGRTHKIANVYTLPLKRESQNEIRKYAIQT